MTTLSLMIYAVCHYRFSKLVFEGLEVYRICHLQISLILYNQFAFEGLL